MTVSIAKTRTKIYDLKSDLSTIMATLNALPKEGQA